MALEGIPGQLASFLEGMCAAPWCFQKPLSAGDTQELEPAADLWPLLTCLPRVPWHHGIKPVTELLEQCQAVYRCLPWQMVSHLLCSLTAQCIVLVSLVWSAAASLEKDWKGDCPPHHARESHALVLIYNLSLCVLLPLLLPAHEETWDYFIQGKP